MLLHCSLAVPTDFNVEVLAQGLGYAVDTEPLPNSRILIAQNNGLVCVMRSFSAMARKEKRGRREEAGVELLSVEWSRWRWRMLKSLCICGHV